MLGFPSAVTVVCSTRPWMKLIPWAHCHCHCAGLVLLFLLLGGMSATVELELFKEKFKAKTVRLLRTRAARQWTQGARTQCAACVVDS